MNKAGAGKRKPTRSFMQGLIQFFERGLFAPFLLSIQPVLQLFLINISELDFSEILRSIFAALLLASIIFAALYLVMRDWIKSSLVA